MGSTYDIDALGLIWFHHQFSGRVVDGREIMVQFAKYGPNAERMLRCMFGDSGRKRDYRYRSRSRSASLDYGLSRGRYNDERQQSRSRSFKSASPLQRSPSPQRSLSPRRTPSESSDRRNRDERSATPLRGRQAYR
ncbi:hypothetical protein U1Q18_031581 [Sarracenia purpurea var. burkii]